MKRHPLVPNSWKHLSMVLSLSMQDSQQSDIKGLVQTQRRHFLSECCTTVCRSCRQTHNNKAAGLAEDAATSVPKKTTCYED